MSKKEKRLFYLIRLTKNPIMLGYIGFILITIIIYLLSGIFCFSFDEWNRIVAATTFSTYLFTFANSSKLEMQHEQKYLKTYHTMIQRAEDYNYFASACSKDQDQETISEVSNEIISDLKEKVNRSEKRINKSQVTYNVLTILGFIVFLLSISINAIYDLFNSSQGLYTMLAFGFMFYSDYMLEISDEIEIELTEDIGSLLEKIIKLEKIKFDNQIKNDLDELDNITQEAENGQDEDAE